VEAGGEMNQALYAHMNNKRKRKKKKHKWLYSPGSIFVGQMHLEVYPLLLDITIY
jgi:hypothetical protein